MFLLLALNKEMFAGLLSCQRRTLSSESFFLQTESSLAVMKNAFYFTLKGFFVLKIFRFCVNRYLCFGHIYKRRKNDKANFEIYYVKTWLTYTHIAQFLKK